VGFFLKKNLQPGERRGYVRVPSSLALASLTNGYFQPQADQLKMIIVVCTTIIIRYKILPYV
jgi:hypothetical protein